MTRKEVTGIRSLVFSQWIRKRLPDSSTGFSASDLDFILWNWKTKKVMLLEVKTRNADLRPGQRHIWSLLHKWIKDGISNEWAYYGFHLIKFENDNFDNGRVWFDKTEISEEKLIELLSLK